MHKARSTKYEHACRSVFGDCPSDANPMQCPGSVHCIGVRNKLGARTESGTTAVFYGRHKNGQTT